MSSAKTCAVCGAAATQQCGNCRAVTYCGRDHQRLHWRETHKNECGCYREENGVLVATRDIPQGAEILREKPLILCPTTRSACTCLGCHKPLSPEDESIKKCAKCSWSLCSESCETSQYHLKECPLLQKIEATDKYDIVVALRYLQLDNEKKKQIEHLRPSASLNSDPITLKEDIGYTQDELNAAHSIVSKNTVEILRTAREAQGLYPKISKILQSCRANTKNVFDENVLVIVATVGIKKGDKITSSHVQTLLGTLERREQLLNNKGIECKCDRCKDHTEFDTFAGSIYCSRCKEKNSEGQSPMIIPTDPLDAKAPWKCGKCARTLPGKAIRLGNETLRKEISQLDRVSPKSLETFIVKYAETLHPHNAHVLTVKYELTQMYGNIPGFTLSEMNNAALERQIDLCNDLLEISDKLDPGWSRFRGCLLLTLQAALVVQSKRKYNDEEITKEDAQETMSEAMILLQEAVRILSPEPEMKGILEEKLKTLSQELDFD